MAKVKHEKGRAIAPMAIKRLDKLMITKMKQIDHVLSEKAILARVDHPFLVSHIVLLILLVLLILFVTHTYSIHIHNIPFIDRLGCRVHFKTRDTYI